MPFQTGYVETKTKPLAQEPPRPSFLLYLALFAAAFLIRIWFNFAANHANAYAAADASEYLRNAAALNHLSQLPTSFFQACLSYLAGGASPETVEMVQGSLARLNEMRISGPVFPLFLISPFVLIGSQFDATNWPLLLGAQSVISALTCIMIALIAHRLWNEKTGLIAGIIAGIYPGFIVNSGRLYSETFAVFLLTVVVYLSVLDFSTNSLSRQFLKGFTLAALQATRSIMVVLTVATLPMTFLLSKPKNRIAAMSALLLGFASIALPWLALQKLAFGTSSLVVDRVGHYNFFTGNHVDSQGWLSVPYPDGSGIEQKSFFVLAKNEIAKHPFAWLKLTADKLPRLLKHLWNDFRTPIGPFTYNYQVALHQFILILAAIGIALGLYLGTEKPSQKIILARTFLLSLILFHLVYCFFITVPRYNLTAMPFVIVFAASGLVSLIRLLLASTNKAPYLVAASSISLFAVSQFDVTVPIAQFTSMSTANALVVFIKSALLAALALSLWQCTALLEGRQNFAKLAISLMLCLAFTSTTMPVRAHGRLGEWQKTITRGSVIKEIALPSASLNNRNLFVLIDADGLNGLTDGTNIYLNGRLTNGPFIPSLSIVGDQSLIMRLPNDNWQFEQEYILDCMTRPADTSNVELRQWFLIPIPPEVLSNAQGKLTVSVEKTGGHPLTIFGSQTNGKSIVLPSLQKYSWEKCFYGVENINGLSDARYDQRLAIKNASTQKSNLNIFLLSESKSSQPTAKPIQTSSNLNTVSLPLSFNKQLDVLMRVKAAFRSSGNSTYALLVTVDCRLADGKLVKYKCPWTTRSIPTNSSWQNVDVSFPIKLSALPGEAIGLNAALLPNEAAATNQLDVKELQASVVPMSNFPLANNWEIHL